MAQVDDTGRDRRKVTDAVLAHARSTVLPHARSMSHIPGKTVAVDMTAVWRSNLEGYLGRKLHRQWRNRGS